jgi:hypothetical protein
MNCYLYFRVAELHHFNAVSGKKNFDAVLAPDLARQHFQNAKELKH